MDKNSIKSRLQENVIPRLLKHTEGTARQWVRDDIIVRTDLPKGIQILLGPNHGREKEKVDMLLSEIIRDNITQNKFRKSKPEKPRKQRSKPAQKENHDDSQPNTQSSKNHLKWLLEDATRVRQKYQRFQLIVAPISYIYQEFKISVDAIIQCVFLPTYNEESNTVEIISFVELGNSQQAKIYNRLCDIHVFQLAYFDELEILWDMIHILKLGYMKHRDLISEMLLKIKKQEPELIERTSAEQDQACTDFFMDDFVLNGVLALACFSNRRLGIDEDYQYNLSLGLNAMTYLFDYFRNYIRADPSMSISKRKINQVFNDYIEEYSICKQIFMADDFEERLETYLTMCASSPDIIPRIPN